MTLTEQVEARFAGHPTLLKVARTLVASREYGPDLRYALCALESAMLLIDDTPVQS